MHRTEAPGNSSGSYVDKNLPAVAGTVLEASDRNAVQDEIANVILRAGLALKTKATETGNQLETVIFDTAITRTEGIDIHKGGFDYYLNIGANWIRLLNSDDGSYVEIKAGTGVAEECIKYVSGTTGREVKINYDGLSVKDGNNIVAISGDGTACFGSGLSSFYLSKATFNLTDSSFNPSETLTGSGVWHDNSATVDLGSLPFPKVITCAFISCRVVSTSARVSVPVNLNLTNNSGFCRVGSMSYVGPADLFSASFDTRTLTVEFAN